MRYSQSRLAREAGVSQPTIAKLEIGMTSGSSQLHRIARALNTTPAYLAGEIDDPSIDAPPPAPAKSAHVMMRVELPSTDALAAMFRGLLRGIDLTSPRDDIARQLAEDLPIGLAQLGDLLPDRADNSRRADRASAEASDAMPHPVAP